MPRIDAAADEVALALNAFNRELNSLYWERVKFLSNRGDLFPLRNASSEVQQKLAELVGSGRYSPLQIRALQAAFQAWEVPKEEVHA